MNKNINNLKQLKNDIEALNIQIEAYSIYNKKDIAEILTKLMSSFEGTKYNYKFLYDIDEKEKCVIIPINGNKYSTKLTLPDNNLNNSQSYKKNSNDSFLLPPSGYSKDKTIKIKYVQEFIDFVFNYRNENNITEIEKQTLNELLDEYLNDTKLAQFLRQNDRKNYISKKENEESRIEFENECMVSRKAIFKCIVDILNNYEENNVSAYIKNSIYKYPNEEKEMITYLVYETLCIKRITKDFKFETLITEDTVPMYELELKNLDCNIDTQINYFELKNTIHSIYWDCINLKKFMNGLENKFTEKQQLEEQDIYDAYLEVINKVKKQYELTKNKKR